MNIALLADEGDANGRELLAIWDVPDWFMLWQKGGIGCGENDWLFLGAVFSVN